MYNSYKNGTEAWWAMKEAIACDTKLQEARDDIACAFEGIIGDFNDATERAEEMEEERDQAQRDLEELEQEFKDYKTATDFTEAIKLLTNLQTAARALEKYTTNKLAAMGVRDDVQESSNDSSPGTGCDGAN